MVLLEYRKVNHILEKTIVELENRKAFQELTMNNIPAYLFTKDKNFKLVQANQKFKALYPEEMQDKIIGYTTLEKYSTEEAQKFLIHDKLAFEKGISENDNVPIHQLDHRFKPLGLTTSEIDLIEDFIINGLDDSKLLRYVPSELPSGNCFPNNDHFSQTDLGCN